MSATEQKGGTFRNSAFAQQKISAWQPVLAPKWMIAVLAFFGLGFIALGIILVHTSNSVVECTLNYDNPAEGCVETGNCSVTLEITEDLCEGSSIVHRDGKSIIRPPIFLYYALTKFYQNHRRYLLSRSTAQLQGEIITDASKLSDCEPVLLSSDGYSILTPCGLAARSVFNDTFDLMDENGVKYTLHDSVDDIVWPSGTKTYFKNPVGQDSASLQKLDQWLSDEIFPGKMENAHFMVWMRNAALPNFRKLYARVDEEIVLPVRVEVHNRYPVDYFGGTKMFVLSTTTWMGGKNPFLGVIFVTLGTLLFIVGLFMAIKNRRDPRILGDVRFLKWTKGKQN
eukprot:Gregarina_sp_Poly_1__5909@NODE_310_length_9629_cov_213_427526_g267_i0_p4_GENE_NODE_310_length_9629_cov_213_427526_g267_i0NODE_310_length_9629_cov_213_427526_g267_i0_p4_ORF_typecomplete_len340_score29_78CDC50/PF03381_15/2_2e71DUF872/PF05915_12/66DUF872/PF05915_12/1_6DUF3592/PF12158_8/4_6e02DUF3592/PF12158_8/2_5e03DUF3592/PF12158_8/3_3e02DUF3592/PF12158_8/19Saf_2TM/PF18303_1/2_1e02Saf_2TM/PF18303_1/2_7DUF3188/PF11384_8/62DUF3188/PF11384_8/7_6DUF1700/PF08006_11/18DUF1700/PF08006_11/14DUF4199/PF1385